MRAIDTIIAIIQSLILRLIKKILDMPFNNINRLQELQYHHQTYAQDVQSTALLFYSMA